MVAPSLASRKTSLSAQNNRPEMFNICKAITIGSYSTPLDKLICKKLALILKKLLPYRMKDPVHFMTDDDLRGGGLEGLLYTLSDSNQSFNPVIKETQTHTR